MPLIGDGGAMTLSASAFPDDAIPGPTLEITSIKDNRSTALPFIEINNEAGLI
jgi:hypothetical protein